ncbi:MAG: glycine/betaine ABC transporter substrate-binding protein [Actinophytocola sp.]|nr:glycine/betaine ABC transporter substrate-binding protein [Actinophytocola sp.]
MIMKKGLLARIAATLAAPLVLAGCVLNEEPTMDVSAGSLAKAADLSGVQLSVGGKEFTEQLVLCEVTAQALESAGATVQRSCGLSGTNSARAALDSGDIDMYWEYTGTGWVTHLGESGSVSDPDKLYREVASRDKKQNGIAWLKPAPANNTYAVAASSETAKKLGVRTLSDYAELAKRNPSQASFCGAAEFFGRSDGWPGLQQEYQFTLPQSEVSELAAGAIYNSIDKADPCAFGEVFATDGRIEALDLTVLEDDKGFFTAYNPAVSIRDTVLSKHPKIADVLEPVASALDNATLRQLNARVDVQGATPEQTSHDWLVKKGFVGAE